MSKVLISARISMQEKAYRLAARYEAFDGVDVRLAVDRVFVNGEGFFVFECEKEMIDIIESELDCDCDIVSYSVSEVLGVSRKV